MKFVGLLYRALLVLAVPLSVAGCGSGTEDRNQPEPARYAAGAVYNGIATFALDRNNYQVADGIFGYTVLALRGTEGLTSVGSAKTLKFADVTINLGIGAKSKTISPAGLSALIELYIAYFNRAPDADGLSYWIDQFKAGRTLDQIGESFYAAAILYSDLTGYSGTMSNADFVRKVYKNVLGRSSPDEEGLNYWSTSLDKGTETRGTLIRTMLASAHSFKGDATFGWVPDLLDNKATVSHYFAVQQGLNYNSPQDSITRGMAIAAAVTPADTTTATSLIGIVDVAFNLLPIMPAANSGAVTLIPSVVQSAVNAGQAAATSIQVNTNGNFPPPANVGVIDPKGVLEMQSIVQWSPYVQSFILQISPDLAPGVHDGTAEVRICKDAVLTCTQPHPGSPWKVPYRIVVTANLVLSDASMAGATPEGTVFSFPERVYTLPTGKTVLDYAVTYEQGSGWLSVSAANGKLGVSANAASLAPGRYSAKITAYGIGAQRVEIPVTVDVRPGFAAPAQLSLQIAGSTGNTASDLTLASSFTAALAKSWTVMSSQPWLVVDTPSGTGTVNNLRVHLDPVLSAAFPNNSTQQATLTISAVDGSFTPATIPVAIAVRLPAITGSAPFHVIAGESETVTLYGANLDQLELSVLTMGMQPVLEPKLVSSSMLTFRAPAALADGLHEIAAPGRLLNTISVPQISPAGAHALQFIPAASTNEPDLARRLVFDDARNDLFASNYSGVARYHYESGAWTRSWLYIPDAVYAIALSPDRRTLVAAARSSLHLIDAQDFTLRQSISYPASGGVPVTLPSRNAAIAFAPGGKLLLPALLTFGFDLQTKTFSAGVPGVPYLGVLSPDRFGNLVFANQDFGISTAEHEWQQWSAGATAFSRAKTRFECNVARVSASRYGEVVSCDSNFYSAEGGLLGSIPSGGSDFLGDTIVSPDAKFAYSVRWSGVIDAYQFSGGLRRVARFTDGGNLYSPHVNYDLYSIVNDLSIAQDGKTLFVALPNGIYVIPTSAFSPLN